MARYVAPNTDPWLSRISKGRVSLGMFNVPSATLTTTGAKSGQIRKAQIAYFHYGRDVIVMASNYAGSKHPQWYHNLLAHPDCELGDEAFRAGEVTDPGEYTRLFALAEGHFDLFADYRERTEDRPHHPGVPAQSAAAVRRFLSSRTARSCVPSRPGANSGMTTAATPTITAITRYDELTASTNAVLLASAS